MGLQLLGPLVVHCLLLPACPAYLAQLDEPLSIAGAAGATSAAAGGAANGGGGLSAKARKAAATEASLRKTDALRVRAALLLYLLRLYLPWLHALWLRLLRLYLLLWQVRGALLHVCGVYFFRHGHLFSASAAPTPPADADADADMSSAPALLPPHEPTAVGGKAPPAAQQRSIGSKRDAPEAERDATQPPGSVTNLAMAELLPRIAVQCAQPSATNTNASRLARSLARSLPPSLPHSLTHSLTTYPLPGTSSSPPSSDPASRRICARSTRRAVGATSSAASCESALGAWDHCP